MSGGKMCLCLDCVHYLQQGFNCQFYSVVVASNGFICVVLLKKLSHSFGAASDRVCLVTQ